jgi:hypothetical protein
MRKNRGSRQQVNRASKTGRKNMSEIKSKKTDRTCRQGKSDEYE